MANSFTATSDESWSGREAPSFGGGELQIGDADRRFDRNRGG